VLSTKTKKLISVVRIELADSVRAFNDTLNSLTFYW